jgi:hypothetical protein
VAALSLLEAVIAIGFCIAAFIAGYLYRSVQEIRRRERD